MILSKLLSLFKKLPKTSTTEATIASTKELDIVQYWDDDYCQVELVPVANKEYILKQIDAINKFSEEHHTEQGYTDVYARDSQPTTTKSEEFT